MDKVEPKERPILFNSDMVCAILKGQKTQSRHPIKVGNTVICEFERGRTRLLEYRDDLAYFKDDFASPFVPAKCPYGKPGDRLWVRETWARYAYGNPEAPMGITTDTCYKADRDDLEIKWRPSIHMPRWASRITLEITSVRVERVQDISREDEIAEGVQPFKEGSPYKAFSALWDSINDKRPGCSWDDNPWVWVIEFKKVEAQ